MVKDWAVTKNLCPAGMAMVLLIGVVGQGCPTVVVPDDGNGNGGGVRTVSFSADIQPILDVHCVDCHRTDGFADLAGIPLILAPGESFVELLNQPSVQRPDLLFVVPGDAEASLLFEKVNEDPPPVGDRMPLFGEALSQDQITLIRDWIDQGALNN